MKVPDVRFKSLVGNGFQEACRGYTQRLCQLLNHQDRGVPGPTLNPTDVGPVQAGLEGKLLLRPVVLLPDPLDVSPQLPPDIHAQKQADL